MLPLLSPVPPWLLLPQGCVPLLLVLLLLVVAPQAVAAAYHMPDDIIAAGGAGWGSDTHSM
jgi:hypothetical protein